MNKNEQISFRFVTSAPAVNHNMMSHRNYLKDDASFY